MLCISKPPKQRKTVTSRNFKNMNIDNFKNDLNYPSKNVLRTIPVNELVNIYNDCVRDAIGEHAPIRLSCDQTRNGTRRNCCKRNGKSARQSGLSRLFIDKCLQYSALLTQSKKEYFSKIIESGNDTKQLFRIAKNLTGKKSEIVIPDCDNR